MKVVAHLACRDGGKLSLIELKTFCSGAHARLHDPRRLPFPRGAPEDLDRQGRLPGPRER